MDAREIGLLIPLALAVLVLGIRPGLVIKWNASGRLNQLRSSAVPTGRHCGKSGPALPAQSRTLAAVQPVNVAEAPN